MTATLEKLVNVRSQLAEEVLNFLELLADKLDQTHWCRGGARIKASEIAVEQFVLTRPRLRSAPPGEERDGRAAMVEKRSPMDEIDAARYELPTNVEEREEERWRQVIRKGRVRLGLRGAPGSGKTFTTRETMARFAREAAAKLAAFQADVEAVELPIWTTARALAQAGGKQVAEFLLAAMESSLQLTFTAKLGDWLKRAIDSSRVFIVVDALDELAADDASDFQARSSQLYGLRVSIVVTCRTMQWPAREEWLGWKRVDAIELAPFKQRQQRELAGKFFQGKSGMAQSMRQLLQVNYSLRHACTTPLLLTFACWLHERGLVKDGTSYAELYGYMAQEMISGNWRDVKPIWSGSSVRAENCLLFLDEIAWRLFSDAPDQNFFTLPAWYRAFKEVRQKGMNASAEEVTMLEQLEQVGIIVPASVERSHQGWSFVHRTLLEFLAARALSQMKAPVWLAIVQPHFWFAPAWLEVLTFLAGLVEDATPLILAVEEEQKEDDLFGSMLYLKAKLSGAAKKVDEQVVKRTCGEVYTFWRETLSGWSMCLENFAASKLIALAAFKAEAKETLVKHMLELTLDENATVRGEAAAVLGRLGAQEAVARLLELTKDEDEDVRRAAVESLSELGAQKAVARLLELTRDVNDWVRWAAVEAISELGAQEAVARLLELILDEDMRWAAVEAISELGAQEAVARLLELTRNEESYVRSAAVEAISKLGTQEDIARLLELTRDEDEDVRRAAAEALGQIGGRQVVSRLLEMTQDEYPGVRTWAVIALGNIGDRKAVDRLLELTRGQGDARFVATRALGEIGDPRAVSSLQELTRDEDKDVRLAAAIALGELGAQEALLELMWDENGWVRGEAAVVLGQLGAQEAVARLLELMQDEDWYTRRAAAIALGQLGAQEAVAGLLELMWDEIEWVRWAAVESLGQLGAQEAVARLLELTGDEDGIVRKAAAAALCKLAWKYEKKLRRE